MKLTDKEKNALNGFSDTQSALSPNGASRYAEPKVRLGDMLDTMQIEQRTKSVSVAFALPAPAGSAATKDFIAFKAPGDGEIVSVELIPSAAWTAGNNVGDKYLTSVRRYNNTPANLVKDHDLVTGIAAGASALLPTGASGALLVLGDDLTISASGADLTLVSESDFVTTPKVGDYVSITSVAANAAGATPANPGIYRVTAVNNSKSLTATKLFGANPEAVATVAAGAGDVSDVRLISATESTFAAGDVIGLRVIVPINTSTPVDVSALGLTAIINYKLNA